MRTANQWPKSDFVSMQAFYGDVGQHQTKIRTPYPLRLAWDTQTTVSRITVHRKTAESVLKVMDTVLYLYGYDAIKALNLDLWAGCLNVRKMRAVASFLFTAEVLRMTGIHRKMVCEPRGTYRPFLRLCTLIFSMPGFTKVGIRWVYPSIVMPCIFRQPIIQSCP